MTVYARKCDECGKGTNVGYYADGAIYCTEKCLNVHMSPEEWDGLYEEGGSDFYYTEWLADESDEQYDAEGNPLTAPCPYCGGSGEGNYWTHNLEDTIESDCHVCETKGVIPVGREWNDALDAAGDSRRDEYFEEHKWAEAKYDAIEQARYKV